MRKLHPELHRYCPRCNSNSCRDPTHPKWNSAAPQGHVRKVTAERAQDNGRYGESWTDEAGHLHTVGREIPTGVQVRCPICWDTHSHSPGPGSVAAHCSARLTSGSLPASSYVIELP